MMLTNDSIARMFKVLDIFNLMLSKLNISIEDYKKRERTLNIYINKRSHDWSVPLDRLHEKVLHKGELIEAYVLNYKNSNTKDEIYKYMNRKLNTSYKVWRS
jgi:hypothetical protein